MDITADNLLNQVASVFLDKIDKQNFDPNFLQKFANSLLSKFALNNAKPIQQTTTTSRVNKTNSLVSDIKKAYTDLIKDASYKNEYKRFLAYVLPETLTKPQIAKQTVKNQVPASTPKINEGRVQLIDKPAETQKVIFDGFSERGWAFFSERLPKILAPLMFKPVPEKTKNTGNTGLLGGGIALLLGGLAALVTGLMTDGPFKGLLKILSKAGIESGIKMLQVAAKIFISGLKEVIEAPITLLKGATKSIGKIFGKEAYKVALKPLRGVSGLFTKMLGGLARFIAPILKKLPLIGTVISWGFAYTRFKSGDVVGGIIDVLSGIANIFAVIPGFGLIGTSVAIGLDVLNAFLDYKAEGATGKTTTKKLGLLKEWTLGLGKYLYDRIKFVPVIGPLLQAAEDMTNGKWLDATYNIVRSIPGLGVVLDIINYFNEGQTEEAIKGNITNIGSKITEWMNWVRENIWEKVTNFVTGVFDGVKDWWNNLSWDPQSWIGANTESSNTKPITDSNTLPQMAKGGIVTRPTKALVGEAGPEAVVPLEKYFNPQQLTLNNDTLKQIASNTNDTNNALKILSDALFKLIITLDKKTGQASSTVINAIGKTAQPYTPASVIANTNVDPIRRVRMQFA